MKYFLRLLPVPRLQQCSNSLLITLAERIHPYISSLSFNRLSLCYNDFKPVFSTKKIKRLSTHIFRMTPRQLFIQSLKMPQLFADPSRTRFQFFKYFLPAGILRCSNNHPPINRYKYTQSPSLAVLQLKRNSGSAILNI